jgi:hypothetical protein
MTRVASLFLLVVAASCSLALLPVDKAGALSGGDEQLLDQIQRAGFQYFWEQSDPETGLTKDRSLANGDDQREVASIAATGFGLSALCIADQRHYLPHAEIAGRVRRTLEFIARRLPNVHGFFYHFLNYRTGERAWESELSSVDTGILLCGALTCRQHFQESDINALAREIYERADWPWMTAGRDTLTMGWKPESGYLSSRWDSYNESTMLYLLAIGSPSHPLPPSAWDAFKRPAFQYERYRYIESGAPLFAHQFSHAWFDFRGRRDRYADYFQNSVTATRAHILFCLRLSGIYRYLGGDLWGITASDSVGGYVAWGGPPSQGPIDGTVVPSAAGGSVPFAPREAMRSLHTMKEKLGRRYWRRYGFVNAFNMATGWTDPDVIGIDLGITSLMAENARTGFVWNTFMKNEEVRRAMDLAGFARVPGNP